MCIEERAQSTATRLLSEAGAASPSIWSAVVHHVASTPGDAAIVHMLGHAARRSGWPPSTIP